VGLKNGGPTGERPLCPNNVGQIVVEAGFCWTGAMVRCVTGRRSVNPHSKPIVFSTFYQPSRSVAVSLLRMPGSARSDGVTAQVRLTPREREIASWMGEDLSYEEIGEQLGISDHCVRKHARSLQRKVGVRRRHAAVAQLAAQGVAVLRRTMGTAAQGPYRGIRQG
jgi:DNA-binding CsgD family transcriptional regulator